MRNLFSGLALVLALSASGAEITFDLVIWPPVRRRLILPAPWPVVGQPGDWKIVLDDVPPLLAPLTAQAPDVAKRAVLAQSSRNPMDEHFPLFILRPRDVDGFQFFHTVQNRLAAWWSRWRGIVFRYQNASNFYVLRASALGRNVRFYKLVDGIRSEPLGPSIDITNGVWHTLAVQCQGNQITCRFRRNGC